MTLGVRPEHLRIETRDAVEGGIPATVSLVEYLGDTTIVYVQADGVPEMVSVKCRADEPAPGHGARVWLAFEPAHGHLFDADGAALPRTPRRT